MRVARLAALTVPASLVALLAASVGVARADFAPIQLQSVGELEQFESAGEAAISGDGRYLAFEGTLAGVRGIYRKELATGRLQLVTGGSIYASEGASDASAPSISTEGRYVIFTSATRLLAAANPGSNVYVRDMDLPPPEGGACDEEEERQENGRRCAYELASALGGSEEGLTYGSEGSPTGALASGRTAFGVGPRGREVAFVVGSSSDLVSHDAAQLTTPPLQVAVRYLDTHETVLVSVERESASGAMTERPVAGGAVTPSAGPSGRLPGAAISGDGSTVAWLGAHIPAQAPTLQGERQRIEAEDASASSFEAYDEPLWRRIGAGAAAPTRRMVGGGDPLAPGCPPGGTLALAACQGPYPDLSSEHWEETEANFGWLGLTAVDNGTPQLSYDGWTAALVGDPSGESNAFVVDMREGLDRDQALRQLTREVGVSGLNVPGLSFEYVSGAGAVNAVAISPNGSRIAFISQRQQFPLAPPNYAEPPPTQVGLVELYQIDLARESLVRVTRGPGGAPSEEGSPATRVTQAGASSPSYDRSGLTLAFADTASNLVAGDSNEASDVFTATDVEVPERPGPVAIAPAAVGQEPVRPQWRLSVVAVAQHDGSAVLYADVPGAGRLSAQAVATVPSPAAHRSRPARRLRARGSGAGSASSASRRLHTELASRTVAVASASSTLPGLLVVPLRVRSSYARLLATAAGLYATVTVAFRGAGGPTLTQTVAVSLRRDAPKAGRRRGSGHSGRRTLPRVARGRRTR